MLVGCRGRLGAPGTRHSCSFSRAVHCSLWILEGLLPGCTRRSAAAVPFQFFPIQDIHKKPYLD